MVCGSHPKIRAIYSTPPCPSLAASIAAYRRRSFSDSHPKNRCIFCSISAEYPSMPHSWIQNLLRGQDTTAQAIREVILDHILTYRTQIDLQQTEPVPMLKGEQQCGEMTSIHPRLWHPTRAFSTTTTMPDLVLGLLSHRYACGRCL